MNWPWNAESNMIDGAGSHNVISLLQGFSVWDIEWTYLASPIFFSSVRFCHNILRSTSIRLCRSWDSCKIIANWLSTLSTRRLCAAIFAAFTFSNLFNSTSRDNSYNKIRCSPSSQKPAQVVFLLIATSNTFSRCIPPRRGQSKLVYEITFSFCQCPPFCS